MIARNANEAMMVPMVRSSEVCFSESMESGGRFCECVWQESSFSRHRYVFICNLLHKVFTDFVLPIKFAKICLMFQRIVFLFNTAWPYARLAQCNLYIAELGHT